MTERKPPEQSWESWVEEQIQDAQRDGEFDRLEGKGRPIPGIEEPYDPMWWVKKLLEREKLSVLPPALEVRARADRMLDQVWTLPGEGTWSTGSPPSMPRSPAPPHHGRRAANDPEPADTDTVLEKWRRRRARLTPASAPHGRRNADVATS
jgi:hypothetical protein